tara:strand:- start:390 stop:1580 length:1191 start_codon:yes stop_codon:yes gene_type:complete
MAPTPSLARLSLVARTGAKKGPKAAKGEGGAKEEKDLGWNGLPEDLWWSIVAAIDEPDACAQIEKMCAPTPEGEEDVDYPWSGWCEDGSLYEWISVRLGWYGDLPDWAAVEAHYQEGRAWATRIDRDFKAFDNAKAYFSHVCAERRRLRDAHARRRRSAAYGEEVRRRLRDSHLREFDDDGRLRRDWYHPYVASLAEYAVGLNWMALEYVPGSIDELEGVDEYPIHGYAEVALVAVRADGVALQFVPGSIDDSTGEQRVKCIEGYVEIAAHALRQTGMALAYVPGSRVVTRADVPPLQPAEWYSELATIAVQTTPDSLRFVPHTHPEYVAIAEVAVYSKPETLEYVPTDLPNYALLAELAITLYPDAIMYVPVTHPDHDALETLAESRGANPEYTT